MCDHCPNTNITFATSRPTSGYAAPCSISSCGKRIYIVYCINVTEKNKLGAELFCNDCGKLMTIRTLCGDCNFPYIDGGQASPCFNKFSILDDNGKHTARLRLLDNNLNVQACKLFTDYYAPGSSFCGGSFSHDGKMIAITYVCDSNLGKDNQKSVLRVLDTKNLCEIACYKYDGNTSVNAKFFTAGQKKYIVLASQGGKYDVDCYIAKPPSLLKILEIKDKTIDLICETEMPEYFHYDVTNVTNDKICILVGTNRANVDGDVIIQNKPQKSFLECDGNEYRVYKFKGNKLTLVYKKNFGVSICPVFYSSNNFVALFQNNGLCSTYQFVGLNSNFSPKNCCSTITQVVPNKTNAAFSGNGEWGIMTGAKSDKCYNHSDIYNYPDELKNAILFNIKN